MKSRLIGKDPEAGKDGGQEEKGAPEGEMVGWHHRVNGRDFEQTLRNSEGQGSLGCCSLWGWEELDTLRDRRAGESHDLRVLAQPVMTVVVQSVASGLSPDPIMY